ncbi:response regulator [Bradyrhizobium sp. CCGUVB14]|nr:response regulator [Bradyrhizobium sp. CCGUVB14]
MLGGDSYLWTSRVKYPHSVAHKFLVLIVEDEFLIRLSAAEMVRELGFEVIEAVDADHAIELLETTADIAIVFTDIQMPGSMDGLGLLAIVRNRWPPIALLVTSGQVEPVVEDLPAEARFLAKPYMQRQLGQHLHALTG